MSDRAVQVEFLDTRWSPLRVRATPVPSPSIAARAASVLASFTVQAIAALLFADGGRAPRYEQAPTAGVVRPHEGDSIEPLTVVFLDEVSGSEDRWPEPRAVSAIELPGLLELDLLKTHVPRVHLGELETLSDTALSVEPVAISGSDRLQLFERYMAQVRARIERAWEAELQDRSRCLAHVTQDRSGVVLDVLLDRCHASAEWKESLVTAIRRASPLPAPPVAQVFAEHLTLEFGAGS